MTKIPLMGAQGALDWQNNGYKSTASAVAELVDNSIQSGAKNIRIVIVQNIMVSKNSIKDIYIIDDGVGMNKDLFQISFQFGGGNKFGAKSGLGRYGMGLPNSSVSQTKRFEAYTWQTNDGKKSLFYNYVDLDEIAKKQNPYLNEVQSVTDMDEGASALINYNNFPSGTIIKWTNVNRVKPKTVPFLVKHLCLKLGLVFRHYIKGSDVEKVKISIEVFDDNGQRFSKDTTLSKPEILPYDPLFLMDNTQLPIILGSSDYNKPTSIESVPAPLSKIDPDTGIEHKVKILFSYINPEIRKKHGRNAGAGNANTIGGQYLRKGSDPYSNISIVRAKREITSGSFGFITDVSETTNRFWSVEVQMESVSDEVFGIDNRKQSADRFKYIDTDDDPIEDDEGFSKSFMREISAIIYANIKTLKGKIKDGVTTGPGPGPGPGPKPEGPFNPTPVPSPYPDDGEDDEGGISDEERKNAEEWLIARFPSYANQPVLLKETIDWFLNLPSKHYIVYSNLGDIELYSFRAYGDKTIIEINNQHSFFDKLISIIDDSDNENAKLVLKFLFSSMVDTEIKMSGQDRALRMFRAQMATTLSWLIDEYTNFDY